MTPLVVDASVVLSWFFVEEGALATDALVGEIQTGGAAAPSLLRSEVGNALVMAERRGRISAAQLNASLTDFDSLPIQIDAPPDLSTLRQIVQLARNERLTVYDASYLELALRHSATLLSKDAALVAAARGLGIVVRP